MEHIEAPATIINQSMRKDGSKAWVAWTNKRVDDEVGRPKEIQCTGVDITAKHLAEVESERSVSLLRATLDSTADAILVVDMKSQIQAYNQRFVDLWNLGSEVFEGGDDRHLLKRVLEQVDEPRAFLDRVEELYSCPERSAEDIIRLRNGRTYRRTSNPQTIEGRIVGRVWSFHDITTATKAEQALAEREALLNAIYQSTTMGIVVAGKDHLIKEANQAFLNMLDHSLEEIRSKRVEDITFAEDRDKDSEPLLRMGKGELGSYQTEKRYVRRDGSPVWGRTTVAPLRSTNGGSRYLIATIENIDEQKKIQERLSQEEGIFDTLAQKLSERHAGRLRPWPAVHPGRWTGIGLVRPEPRDHGGEDRR